MPIHSNKEERMPIIIQQVVDKTRTPWTQWFSVAFTFSVKDSTRSQNGNDLRRKKEKGS